MTLIKMVALLALIGVWEDAIDQSSDGTCLQAGRVIHNDAEVAAALAAAVEVSLGCDPTFIARR